MEIRGTRWRRYGHDRTYLDDCAGRRLGWVDNTTGHLTVEAAEHAAALEQWVRAHAPQPPPQPPPPRSPAPPPTPRQPPRSAPPSSPPAWTDLSANRPGQAARQQADAHLAAARERSRFWSGVARVLDVHTDERAWRVGANGEESVGERLNQLRRHGWYVLHAIPVGTGSSDIDHLLIGPGGVWTINTKNHPGKRIWVSPKQIRVDGRPVPYLRNSRHEADRVRRILRRHLGWEPFVQAALVFLTGALGPDVTIKQMPEHVLVLDRSDTPGAVLRSPHRLPAALAAQAYEIARRSTTWHP